MRFERALQHHPVFAQRIVDSNTRRENPRGPDDQAVQQNHGERPAADPDDQGVQQNHSERPAADPDPVPGDGHEMQMDIDPMQVNEEQMDTEHDQLMGALQHCYDNAEDVGGFEEDVWSDAWEAEQIGSVPQSMVTEAKRAELAQLHERNTMTIIDKKNVGPETKVIGSRWVVVNKGTTADPKVKARLVCQEFARTRTLEHFSGAPGLAAVKIILAELASRREGRCLMVCDITGAFLYGKARRSVAVRLPPEMGLDASKLGLLNKSLYGLRDAPQI